MKQLKFDEKGLVTAVVQDVRTLEILMVAMMNGQAYERTRETKKAHFWSRSRNCLWLKGETSGNIMDVKKIRLDCDGDAVLLMVDPRGPACHTNSRSCFFVEVDI